MMAKRLNRGLEDYALMGGQNAIVKKAHGAICCKRLVMRRKLHQQPVESRIGAERIPKGIERQFSVAYSSRSFDRNIQFPKGQVWFVRQGIDYCQVSYETRAILPIFTIGTISAALFASWIASCFRPNAASIMPSKLKSAVSSESCFNISF